MHRKVTSIAFAFMFFSAYSEGKEKVVLPSDLSKQSMEKSNRDVNKGPTYLGDNAKVVERLVIRSTGAIVILKEPCGAQAGYLRARVFAYEGNSKIPTAQRAGCYNESNRQVYESDGVSIGNPLVDVPTEESFSPATYFLPLDNDPRNQPPKIEALGVGSEKSQEETNFITIGITRQPCPIDGKWLLARHIPTSRADNHEKCWRDTNSSFIEVRNFDYSAKPLRLEKEKLLVPKDVFFEATTIHTTPKKYSWP